MTIKIEYQELSSKRSDNVEFNTPKFKACVWKERPNYVDRDSKYFIYKMNLRIATHKGRNGCYYHPTIVGNKPLLSNKVISWNIKILKSSNGNDIYIGVHHII